MSDFNTAFERLLGHEGAFTANPKDRGNWTSGVVGKGELKGTKYGIAAHQFPHLDIANLTTEDARAIYKERYWDKVRGDDLPYPIAFELFDAAVNHGVKRAIDFAHEAVGVEPSDVLSAAVFLADSDLFIRRFNGVRLEFFTNLRTWPDFGRGWARRVANNLRA
jgi:lysozyme family protein